MPNCLTCRRRKVKCDGRPNTCRRCEKLGIECLVAGTPAIGDGNAMRPDFTQAGYRRIRIPAACNRCREKKLKCDARKPSCSLCVKKAADCVYAASRQSRQPQLRSPSVPAAAPAGLMTDDAVSANSTLPNSMRNGRAASNRSGGVSQSPARTDDTPQSSSLLLRRQGLEVPSGDALLPYLDSFLENVHPISCNNFLHPGCLCEGLDRAPPLLLLALCASSSKFMAVENAHRDGLKWAEEAKWQIMRSLDHISSLTVSAIQFLALHEIHRAEYTAAANIAGIGIRMALDLKLHIIPQDGIFLEQECRRRLMWSVFVSDLLFNNECPIVETELLLDLPLPCNIWSFTQGVPCRTLTLEELQRQITDTSIQQATNHCAYLISILAIRRNIIQYIKNLPHNGDIPWLQSSYYNTLCEQLRMWKTNLPANYAFVERSMFMFRVSRHLDIFLMIHAYYHQSCLLLFRAFADDAWPEDVSGMSPRPSHHFIEDCTEKRNLHAVEISLLVQRLLKVENDHVFRDPWFGTCIWDSMLALLSYSRGDDTRATEMVDYIRLNMRALKNTKEKIPLAGKIYEYCCAAIKHYGFDKWIEVEAERNETVDLASFPSPRAFRYPFFQPCKQADSPEWERLFKTTSGNAANAAARDETPAPSRPSRPAMAFELLQPVTDGGLLSNEDIQSQMLQDWPMGDLQWWQMQQSGYSASFGLPEGLVPVEQNGHSSGI